MNEITGHPLRDFFDFHRARVTPENIRDNCPGDPGHAGYLRFLEGVRENESFPEQFSGDLWEVVCCPPIGLKEPLPLEEDRFHQKSLIRYRNFVFSMALGCRGSSSDGGWSWLGPISWLLRDADR